jgi:imidazole glycerol-phosphate synthase subunit HisH
MKSKVAIIDYGRGNVQSIINAVSLFDVEAILTSDKNEILEADAVILPGVGAFGPAMEELKKRDLVSTIHDYVKMDKFFLGVCLGMQLLFDKSCEFGENEGLGIIPGEIVAFPEDLKAKRPHISWNAINRAEQGWDGTLFRNTVPEDRFYFVHSYICMPKEEGSVLATSSYGGINFCSSVKRGNVYGCQFHPEKSSKSGLEVLHNFLDLVKEGPQ